MRGLFASPLGFLIGLSLGALGGGGSILAVPVLVYVAGQDARAATTTSLVIVGAASLLGMADHWRAGRVRVGDGVIFGLAGIPGSLVGSALNRNLDPDVLLLAFSGLVAVAAWRMVTGCPSCTNVGAERAQAEAAEAGGGVAVASRLRLDASTVTKVIGAGTLVGFFTGLFGVGGGFVIVPALTLLLGFNMPQAVGTSLLIITINSVTALSARLGAGGVEWSVTIPFAVASMAGVITGTRMAGRIPASTMLRWFAALLVGVAVYTATRATLALT